MLAGCVGIEALAPPVTPMLAARARADSSTLAAGRRIYLTKCASCHAADPVADYADEWPHIIRKMAPKSKLSPAEEHAVLAYVLAASR